MKFYLQRKTGYQAPYHLSMVYPSYKASVFHQGVGPTILMEVGGKSFEVPAWITRFPSWIARKASGYDEDPIMKTPGWKAPFFHKRVQYLEKELVDRLGTCVREGCRLHSEHKGNHLYKENHD